MHPSGQSFTPQVSTRDPVLPALDRQRAFRVACAVAGMSVRAFAKALDVHPNHLYLVLRGSRESRRVDEAVAAFIAQHLPDGLPATPPPPRAA